MPGRRCLTAPLPRQSPETASSVHRWRPLALLCRVYWPVWEDPPWWVLMVSGHAQEALEHCRALRISEEAHQHVALGACTQRALALVSSKARAPLQCLACALQLLPMSCCTPRFPGLHARAPDRQLVRTTECARRWLSSRAPPRRSPLGRCCTWLACTSPMWALRTLRC